MKLLSIAIPSYNSEAYMANCIESLLPGGEEVEILVINDGSKDGTGDIANAYAEKYPTIVRAIHQENGGHGEAVNAGLRNATGTFFKVVDSDDWVDVRAYKLVLELLRKMDSEGTELDMLLSNFVYDKQGASRKKVMNYRSALPTDRLFGWDEVKKFRKGQYILMHSVIYRTGLLRDCGLELPKHTFYVDNIFVYQPLPYVKNMYYLDVDFYHYFIGRNDQSVNEKVMIQRIDQQLLVNRTMIDCYNLYDEKIVTSKRLRQYMMNYLEIICSISSVMLIRSHTEEGLQKRDELWAYFKEHQPKMYRRIRRGIFGIAMTVKSKPARKTVEVLYFAAQRIFGFN